MRQKILRRLVVLACVCGLAGACAGDSITGPSPITVPRDSVYRIAPASASMHAGEEMVFRIDPADAAFSWLIQVSNQDAKISTNTGTAGRENRVRVLEVFRAATLRIIVYKRAADGSEGAPVAEAFINVTQ